MGEELEWGCGGLAFQTEREDRKEKGSPVRKGRSLRATCYFCDTELQVVLHTFRVGPREEPVCEECYLKTVNRRAAKAEEEKGGGH